MGKPKYPRLTRENNLNCKLTDKDIADIRARFGAGEKPAKIAEDYPQVRPHSLYYWFKTPEQRKEANRQDHLGRLIRGTHKDPTPEEYKRFRARKLKLTNLAEYERLKELEARKTVHKKEWEKDYRPKYRAKIAQKVNHELR